MEARGVWKGGFETRLDDGRGHGVTIDLPSDEGGSDAGTSSLELLVLSLAGCIITIFGLVAAKRRLTFEGLTVSLTANRPPRSPTIQAVRGRLTVRTEATREEVEAVARLTLRTCPVGVLFERANVPIELSVEITPSPPTPQDGVPRPSAPEPT